MFECNFVINFMLQDWKKTYKCYIFVELIINIDIVFQSKAVILNFINN